MARFNPGESFDVPCLIEPGSCAGEKRITIKRSNKNDLCGYVAREYLQFSNDRRGFVRGKVIDVRTDLITVQIPGYFSTPSGHAALRIRCTGAHSRARSAA